MYNKIIELPISYYSEKKGDIMARMLGDVNEVQNSFSLLELVIKEPLTIIFALGTMFIISTN
jgi:subfamily B ATP-binding cassette protein MsbA